MRFLLSLLLLAFSDPFLHAQVSTSAKYPTIHLTDSVNCTNVKDQSQSPTCWVFTSNSLFESDILKKTGQGLDLSEMFIARYAYIDKAKMFLASKGKTYFEGGGNFPDVIREIDKYGIVPEDIYPGKPANQFSHNHAGLDTAMKTFVHGLLDKGKMEMNEKEIQQVNDTLDKYLGKLPATFNYGMEIYTAKTFAQKILGPSSNYIELMSFADLPFYKKCLLQDKYNWAGDSLYNIPLEDFQMMVDTALAKGWSVGWEGDVTNPGFNFWYGYASLSDTSQLNEEERSLNFKNGTTERDHMLHLVGIGRDEHNGKWYYLKNSWGVQVSTYNGFLFMDENYFRMNTAIMMLNKAALPVSLKRKLGL